MLITENTCSQALYSSLVDKRLFVGSEGIVDTDMDPQESNNSFILRTDALLVSVVLVACGLVGVLLYHMSYRREASAKKKMKQDMYPTYRNYRDAGICHAFFLIHSIGIALKLQFQASVYGDAFL